MRLAKPLDSFLAGRVRILQEISLSVSVRRFTSGFSHYGEAFPFSNYSLTQLLSFAGQGELQISVTPLYGSISPGSFTEWRVRLPLPVKLSKLG